MEKNVNQKLYLVPLLFIYILSRDREKKVKHYLFKSLKVLNLP
jgi:hypothetical protein